MATLKEQKLAKSDQGFHILEPPRNCQIGNLKEIKSFQLERYDVVFTSDILAISCQQHPIEKWKEFSDIEISEMDKDALSWWKKWKDFIFQAIELSKGE